MVPLEYNGGMASGPAEIIVIAVLALALVAIGLLLWHSLKKITVPYADEQDEHDEPIGGADGPDARPEDIDGRP